jgi:hypothetical protein
MEVFESTKQFVARMMKNLWFQQRYNYFMYLNITVVKGGDED